MVKYTCKLCGKDYDSIEDAEKCENQGLIGPSIKPGLLLSHKKAENSFKIFYKELPPKGHERNYEFEDFLIWKSTACPLQPYCQSASNFIKGLENFNVATNKEIKKINKLIKKSFPMIRLIKTSMNVNNIKKIHNNLESKTV